MPLTLAKMTANTVTVSFTYAGETVNVVYRPALVTEKTLGELQSFASVEKLDNADISGIIAGLGDLNKLLVRIVASWDVQGDDGAMYPITEESLPDLPLDYRMAVFSTVFSDIQGNAPAQTTNPQS